MEKNACLTLFIIRISTSLLSSARSDSLVRSNSLFESYDQQVMTVMVMAEEAKFLVPDLG
jgi:hypothetical protein